MEVGAIRPVMPSSVSTSRSLHLRGGVGGQGGMGVLDAAQAGHLFEAVAVLDEGWMLESVEFDVGDFHGGILKGSF